MGSNSFTKNGIQTREDMMEHSYQSTQKRVHGRGGGGGRGEYK